jgi:hypothetical protein
MQGYKRQQRNTLQNTEVCQDSTSASLQTLGMRIRQSISNGYKLPESTSINSYMNLYEQQHAINNMNDTNNFKRVPLPAHLANNGPPALDYNGSTASSLSCWEDEINRPHHVGSNFHSIDTFYNNLPSGTKRGISEVENKEMQVSDYVERYGPLSFNEEF